jgi:hypothetical protein
MSLKYYDLNNIKSMEELNEILSKDCNNINDLFNNFSYSDNPIAINIQDLIEKQY